MAAPHREISLLTMAKSGERGVGRLLTWLSKILAKIPTRKGASSPVPVPVCCAKKTSRGSGSGFFWLNRRSGLVFKTMVGTPLDTPIDSNEYPLFYIHGSTQTYLIGHIWISLLLQIIWRRDW
jgi:hypothetical protein